MTGKTALHVAVEFRNFKAISGMLMVGADINITDVDGKTAVACKFPSCAKDYCEFDESDSEFEDKDDKMKEVCVHVQTIKKLAIHIQKLQICGVDINKQNEDFASKAFEKLKDRPAFEEQFFKELEKIKTVKIASGSLTLYDFTTEYDAVIHYPRMTLVERNYINEFFSSNEVESLRENFPNVAEIIQLQFRKARARSLLLELAYNAVTLLISIPLPPEIYSDFIFVYLKNSELKNLIDSAKE